MSNSQATGRRAEQILYNQLPTNWIMRPVYPDYGIDFDLELFGRDGITLGEHVYIQLKGKEKTEKIAKKINGNTEQLIKVPKFEVSELNLVENMGASNPVLLIVIDISTEEIFYLCLNDYIRNYMYENDPKYKEQKTVTIYIPEMNKINSIFLTPVEWFACRGKMISMLQEMLADIRDIEGGYSLEYKIQKSMEFVDRYKNHYALDSSRIVRDLKPLKIILKELREGNYITQRNHELSLHPYLFERQILNVQNKYFSTEARNVTEYLQLQSFSQLFDMIDALNLCYNKISRKIMIPGGKPYAISKETGEIQSLLT